VTPTATRAGRTARGADTRETILERAADLSSVEGLEGLTIGRLADELSMSKSGLFRHFGSKQELQLATVEWASTRFIEVVVAPAFEAPEGVPRLRAICARYLAYLETGVFDGGCFFGAATIEFDGRPGPVQDRIRDAVELWLATIARIAREAGVDDPEQLAFEVHCIVQGANQRSQLGDRQAYERARTAFDRLLP
jgi:AcrR family transcriptional regulator